ncbi:MAG: translation initiation factor IF-2 [Clostridia bacterium]
MKQKIQDVAKDLKMTKKEILEILKDVSPNAQTLDSDVLNYLLEKVTKENQVEDITSVLDSQKEQKKPQPKAEKPVVKEEKPVKKAEVENKKQKPKPKQQILKPTPKDNDEKITIKTDEEVQTPNVRVIDTRSSGDTNLAKYDDKMDSLVPDKASKMQQGKQKITKKSDSRKPYGQNKKRQEDQERLKRLAAMQAKTKATKVRVQIPEEISVGELASRLKRTAADVIKELMKLGVMASISQVIDFDTASIVAEEMNGIVEKEVFVTIEERLFDETDDNQEDLIARDPVVVVMGHVDHGKTSLLDAVRKAKVADDEAGGITQHIGAYQTEINGNKITFLDTPGHAAFTSMRARGAQVTDIAILVVAADDGIMPQTIEAINHAKAAEVPIIVAVNKIDKDGANPDRIMQQLTEYELVPEEWGGSTTVCKISAKFGKGIEDLLEMVLLTAEVEELKANPNRLGKGTVIEAKLDKGRGPVATLLVQNGTLKSGDIIIAGTSVGRVRAMTDDLGNKLEEAGPSMPVEIIGLSEVPSSGELFYCVEDERMARELVEQRKEDMKTAKNNALQKVTLDNLFSQIEQGSIKNLNIIVKADVHGSAEALKASLEKLHQEDVRVRVIHSGVGAISESDVMLAAASGAIIVGFNVRPERTAYDVASAQDVDMRMYSIIYDCIGEIETAMKGMLEIKYKEVILGHAEVRQVFRVTGVGTIAGAYVQDGKLSRNAEVRVVRDGIVFHEGKLNSLKRFKDDARDVASGYECGLGVEDYNDIKEGDIIECYIMEEIAR